MSEKSEGPAGQASEAGGDALIGTVLGGRYRLEVLLGSGAMGRVYRAEHVHMKKPLAVKVLNAEHTKSPELVLRFEREATAAANIEHPNVVAATDFGKLDDGTAYLALELVEGKNLRAEVAHGPLEVRRALHVARQIAAGLAAAHARGIVHRDLKPENVVLIAKDGDPDFVKILDFGVAKLAPESGKSPLTKVGAVLGTLDYMAPEQALGQEVDQRADLYALGAVLYEMLSGACPYEGESSSAILGLQLKKPPPSLSERAPTLAIPGAVEALVMKLLARDRKDRPASATAVVAELERVLRLSPKGAAPSPASAPHPPRPGAAQNKPTFLPTDPLPAFTFPPVEAESKKLAEDVKQAVLARGQPPAAPSRPAPPPAPSRSAPPPAPNRSAPPRPPSRSGPPPAPRRSAPPAAPSRPAPPPAPPFTSPVSSSPSVDALLANLPSSETPAAPPAPAAAALASPMSSSPSVDMLLAHVVSPNARQPDAPDAAAPTDVPNTTLAATKNEPGRDLRARAGEVVEAAIVWVDDHRRFLPRFIKRPLRRVPSGVLLAGAVVLAVTLVVTLVSLASGSSESSDAAPAGSATPPAP